MSIRKFYVNSAQAGYPFDRKVKKWFSWGFDFQAGGQRYQERGFLTKTQAEEVVAQIKAKAKNSRHGLHAGRSPFLIELLQTKLESLTGADRTRAKRVFRDFLSLLPKTVKVIELESADFEKYNQKRLKENISPATIRRELVHLVSALFSAGLSHPALKEYRPPKIPRPPVPKMRKTRTITFGERRCILEYLYAPAQPGETAAKTAARHETASFLQFALLTASRPGEVASLRKTDVDIYSGIVQIAGGKTKYSTGVVRYIPITTTMQRILVAQIARAEGEYLFTPNGRVQERMYKALKAACEASGIKYGKHDRDGVIFYTARHTATTELVQNQVDTRTAGAYTGHANETMTLHYSHPNRQTLAGAAGVLEENMGGIFDTTGEDFTSLSENN